MELRAYARAKHIVDHARKRSDLPDTPMIQRVQEIEFALAEAEIEARKHGG